MQMPRQVRVAAFVRERDLHLVHIHHPLAEIEQPDRAGDQQHVAADLRMGIGQSQLDVELGVMSAVNGIVPSARIRTSPAILYASNSF